MPTLRVLKPLSGPDFNYARGDQFDLDDPAAQALIDAGICELASETEQIVGTRPTPKAAKPKRGRR